MGQRILRAVCRTSGANRALKEQAVDTGDIAFDFEEVSPLPRAFRKMIREGSWEVAEMALSVFLAARAGGIGLTGIPVFLVRDFHHKSMVASNRAPVSAPKDLEGRRVGVNRGYTATPGVWAREILASEYGVDLDQITWARSADEHVETWEGPANVEPLAGEGTLEEQLREGVARAAVGLVAGEGTHSLIEEPFAAGQASLSASGLWPINHLIVIRDDVLAETPGVARAIFDAFAAAKAPYVDDLLAGRIPAPGKADKTYAAAAEILGGDPLPYGLAPNIGMLERMMDAAVAQGVLAAPADIAGLFAEDTREAVA